MPAEQKNVAFTFDISLIDTASRPAFKANPTLATGDFKVSKDNGALANLGTLPTVSPASGRIVRVVLSQAEMNADRVTVVCADAAGDEWDEVIIAINTTAETVDTIKTETALIVADTDELQQDNVPGLITTLDNVVDTVKVDTAAILLDTDVIDDGTSGLVKIAQDVAAVLVDTGTTIPATITTIDNEIATIDTVVDAIKVPTDKMVFSKTNELDVNTKSINDAEVVGDGDATPWDGA